MPEYLSPGVYVEEVDAGPKPIEGAGTSTAAFVGFTEKAELVRVVDGEVVTENLLNKPQLVTNWSQYVQRFGGFVPGAYLPQSIYGFFQNGGSRCYVVSVRTMPTAEVSLLNTAGKPGLLVRSAQAGLEGGKLRVRVEDVVGNPGAAKKPATAGKPAEGDAKKPEEEVGGDATFKLIVEKETADGGYRPIETFEGVTLQEVEVETGPTVKVAYKNNRGPSLIDLLIATEKADLVSLWPKVQEQSLRIAPAQLPAPSASEFQGDVMARSGVEGLEVLDDVTIVCVPDLMTPPAGGKLDLGMVKAVQTAIIAHCERLGNRVAVLDTPPDLTPMEVKDWRMNVTGFDSSYATMYYPWIQVMDLATDKSIYCPPSGYLAGLWARTDNTRGVHKAPANEVVMGATGLAYQTTKGEQDTLNPNGINCIRAFPGAGIRVWGARTLSSDPSWRYINVRRLFNYVETSIEGGTQWVVFEPNDRKLWARVRRDINAFLKTVWRSGALFGSSPTEAFYVRCDDELNPPETRDLGQLIIEIGMCPVKPAEFVIFRISQWAGPGAE